MIVKWVESIEKTTGIVESISEPVETSSTVQAGTVKQFEARLGQVGSAIYSDASLSKSIVVVLVVKIADGFFGQSKVAMKLLVDEMAG